MIPFTRSTARARRRGTTAAAMPPSVGLLRRYVAAAGTSTAVDGTPVTSWTDRVSGKVASLVGPTPSGITFIASGPLRGQPCLRNAGANNNTLNETADAALAAANPLSFALVTQGSPGQTGYRDILTVYNGNGWDFALNSGFYLYAGGIAASAGGAYDTAAHTFLGTLSSAGAALYRDGVLSANSAGSYAAPSATTPLIMLGSAGNASWLGDLYEVLVWDHVLSGAERTELATYVRSAYGI